jgi:hypothetical protein
MRARVTLLVLLAASVPSACSGPSDGVITSDVPTSDGFPVVSDVLGAHCGSLDCHGNVGRNLRVYGLHGLRLDPATRPDGVATTVSEYEATYDAVIALEPEILAAVFADHGRQPERLAMVRKERGTEDHKGNAIFGPGDDGDRCLVSWVSGAIDAAACTRASKIPRP